MHSSLGFWSVYSVTSIVLKAIALTNHKTKSRLLTWLKHQPRTWTIFAGATRMWIHPSGTCSRCTTKTTVLYSLCDNTTLPQYKSMRFCKTLTIGAFRKRVSDQRCTAGTVKNHKQRIWFEDVEGSRCVEFLKIFSPAGPKVDWSAGHAGCSRGNEIRQCSYSYSK